MLPELVPVSHVTGMRPKAIAANKVELLGFHGHNRKPNDVKTQIYDDFTYSHFLFATIPSYKSEPVTIPSLSCSSRHGAAANATFCLGDSKHFSCVTSGEINHILNEKYF